MEACRRADNRKFQVNPYKIQPLGSSSLRFWRFGILVAHAYSYTFTSLLAGHSFYSPASG
jgi:hypothetical protein